MKQPVDHILRPRLPWRDVGEEPITECGYDAMKVSVLTREAYFARLKDLGQQRCALLTCMTCADTARRWGTWDDDPRLALGREITWERGDYYWSERTDRGSRLRDELTAIAELIAAHRDEFDAALVEVAQRRAWNAALEDKRKREQRERRNRERGL
jgi:hypothetical protein